MIDALGETRVGLSRCSDYHDAEVVRSAVISASRAALGGADSSLASVIRPGASVLIKPNWVLDHNRSGASMDCMITHRSVVEAVLMEVVAARPARIVVGDAPIQEAKFDTVVPFSWRARLSMLAGSVPLEIVDLRNVVTERNGLSVSRDSARRQVDRIVVFDLGRDSLLEEVSEPSGRFRCTNYDPTRITGVQGPGVHKYALAREALDADVIVNVPKLKTHRKAGITAALKNLVGVNADKDYLPHHRVGSPAIGGDCYSEQHVVKRAAEYLLDLANHRVGRRGAAATRLAAALFVRPALRIGRGGLEGAWYGNDTIWRTTLDLNRIALYGDIAGEMHETPQRSIVTITDAITAGQGDGPLAPVPLQLGYISFARNSAFADLVHASLMKMDWKRIPTLSGAFRDMRWPIVSSTHDQLRVFLQGEPLSLDETLMRLSKRTIAPPDWQGHVEVETSPSAS